MKKIVDFDKKSAALQKRMIKEAVAEASKVILSGNLTAEVYSTKEAAAFLKRSPLTLFRWREAGVGPKATVRKDTKSIFYTKESLKEYIEANHDDYSDLANSENRKEMELIVEQLFNKIRKKDEL